LFSCSYVFACFVDFRKVSYWKLFAQMLRDGTNLCFVKIPAFWYSLQPVVFTDRDIALINFVLVMIRSKVGVLSPYLFKRFVRPLISAISQSRLGCNIGGMFVNLFASADDMVILAPSWYAMHALIQVLDMWCTEPDIACNTTKTD